MNSIVQPSLSDVPSPEVQEIKRRRTISPAEKRRILQAYDSCKDAGERGAVLRRERVYSSMLSNWRKQVRTTAVRARRGPKVNPPWRSVIEMRSWRAKLFACSANWIARI